MTRTRGHRRPSTWGAVTATLLLVGATLAPARADSSSSNASVSGFDLNANGSVVDFTFSYPTLVLPFVVNGGILGATTVAQGVGRSQGIAGPAPVPIATSLGLIIPEKVPVLGTPIPPQVQAALKAINYKAFPNYCESDFPPFGGESTTASCGGPNQNNTGLAFTYQGINGATTSAGDPSNPLAATSTATS